MSSERSGSNLVRRILGSHDEVYAPTPPHLYKNLTKLLPYYGDIKIDSNFEKVVEDALEIIRIRGKWKCTYNKNQIIERVQSKTISNLIDELYTIAAEERSKNYYVNKENELFNYTSDICLETKDPRIIYLVRDGRDVACSANKYPPKRKHIYMHSKLWKKEQLKAIRAIQNLPSSANVITLKYENLLSNTEAEIRNLCEFIGLNFTSEMINFHLHSDSKKEAESKELYSNLNSPIIRNNVNKYKTELSIREIRIFETLARDILSLNGYELVTEKNHNISTFKSIMYRIINYILNKKKNNVPSKEVLDLNHFMKIKKDEYSLLLANNTNQ